MRGERREKKKRKGDDDLHTAVRYVDTSFLLLEFAVGRSPPDEHTDVFFSVPILRVLPSIKGDSVIPIILTPQKKKDISNREKREEIAT